MRFILLIIFCTIGLTASAQFWRRKPKPPQPAPLVLAQMSPPVIKFTTNTLPNTVHTLQLTRSVYDLEVAEEAMLKEAKHNMRFRIYSAASYNFSDLAAMYLKQNRFSEAKWYLLQSNTIARQTENTRHLLDNLFILADIKTTIGELGLAMADLQEAHDIAVAKGMQTDVIAIAKKTKYLQTNKTATTKAELRYAEAVELTNSKAPVIKPVL